MTAPTPQGCSLLLVRLAALVLGELGFGFNGNKCFLRILDKTINLQSSNNHLSPVAVCLAGSSPGFTQISVGDLVSEFCQKAVYMYL